MRSDRGAMSDREVDLLLSLRFLGDEVRPDTISRTLRAEPTHAFNKGDHRIGTAGVRHRANGWIVDFWSTSRRKPKPQWQRLVAFLSARHREFDELEELGIRGELFCSVFPTRTAGHSLALANRVLSELARCHLDLVQDLHATDGHDERA